MYKEESNFIKDSLSSKPIKEEKKALFEYGKINFLLNDDEVSDIKILAYNKIKIKRSGARESVKSVVFANEEEYLIFINLIFSKNNVDFARNYAVQSFTDKTSNKKIILKISVTSIDDNYCINIRKLFI